jgi:hypothetical protein
LQKLVAFTEEELIVDKRRRGFTAIGEIMRVPESQATL